MQKDRKFWAIVALAVVAVILLAIIMLSGETATYDIQDKCGRFVNLFSHTINDEGQCKTRCESQCAAKDLNYRKVDFVEVQDGCNTCTCYCTTARW